MSVLPWLFGALVAANPPQAGANEGVADSRSETEEHDMESDDADPPVGEDAKKKKKKNRIEFESGKAKFRFRGRVMGGWEIDDRRPAPDQGGREGTRQEVFLQQVRLNFGADYADVLKIRIGAELSDAWDPPAANRVPYLRNGYANVRVVDPFQIRAGFFRRPFSRLEMRGVGDLPFRGRGLANRYLVRGRNFGGRTPGMMVWGDIDKARLRWSAGAFHPGLNNEGIDAVARLKTDATKWLSLGVSGGYKRVDPGTDVDHEVGSVSADVRVKVEGLYLMADLVAGQDYLAPTTPWSLGIVGYASYDIDLPKGFALQALMLAEWTDADTGVLQSEAMRLIVGTNVLWKKDRVRVMPQAEFIRPLGEVSALNPWVERDTYYVFLAVEI